MSLAKLTIVGNLGQTPTLRDGREPGTKFATATVAVNRGKGDARTTQWFDVAVNGKLGEAFAEYCAKGDLVYLDGDLTVRDKDGKTYLGIRVDTFRNCAPKGDEADV